MPDHLKTTDICLRAVKYGGFVLQYVPEPLKTSEICKTAVSSICHGSALRFVPDALINAEICLAAVRNDHDKECLALRAVPDDLKTSDFASKPYSIIQPL